MDAAGGRRRVATAAGQSLAHGQYPFAYWGRLGGVGEKDQTVNWAWNEQDRDKVTYAAHDLLAIEPVDPWPKHDA
jgi:hypothetical protein